MDGFIPMIQPILKYGFQTPRPIIVRLCQENNLLLTNTSTINNRRYQILTFKDNQGNKIRHAILFKKQRFHAFGVIFAHKGEDGEGETVNKDDFDNVLIECDKIFFVYQNLHSLETQYIDVLELYKLYSNGKAYDYFNNVDKKQEIIFSCKYLKYFN